MFFNFISKVHDWKKFDTNIVNYAISQSVAIFACSWSCFINFNCTRNKSNRQVVEFEIGFAYIRFS